VNTTADGWIDAFLRREALPESYRDVIATHVAPLGEELIEASRGLERPLSVGLCGAQGSGKSTLTAALAALLGARGLTVAALSLDDFYLTRAERRQLAASVHPLLATRGVPGTHDVALALRTFALLAQEGETALPSFDKAIDDRRDAAQWPRVPGPAEVVLFEGWCVGARPQSAQALATPINALERDEDARGDWRRHVNDALADPYRPLFDGFDRLLLLQAPSFEVVFEWRREQEQKLARRLAASGGDGRALMNEAQLARFIAHYERLTRHILDEMPARADMLFTLDARRHLTRHR
jgi:D-glycerate 3-kinase